MMDMHGAVEPWTVPGLRRDDDDGRRDGGACDGAESEFGVLALVVRCDGAIGSAQGLTLSHSETRVLT